MPPQTVDQRDWETAKVIKAPTPDDWNTAKPVSGAPPTDDNIWASVKRTIQGMGRTERSITQAIKANPATTGAIVGGAVAAPFTGGMSLFPAMGMVGGMTALGAGIGQGIADTAHGVTPDAAGQRERDRNMAEQGLMGAAGEAGGRVIAKAFEVGGPKVAEYLYRLGLRPPRFIRQRFTGASAPSAVGVREGLLPQEVSVQARLSAVEQQVQDAVAAADVPPRTAGLLTSGTDVVHTPLGPAATGESGAVVTPARAVPDMIDPRRLQGGGQFGPVYSGAEEAAQIPRGFAGPGAVVRDVPHVSPPGAGAPPTMTDPRRLADKMAAFVMKNGDLNNRALRTDAIEQLKTLRAKFLSDYPVPLTVSQALAMKRAEQTLASTAYNTIARGGDVNAIETLFHQGMADAARDEVIRLAPSVKELLAQEQGLIGLKMAAEFAAERPEQLARYIKIMSAVTGLASGHPREGILGAVVIHALQSPNVMGAIAIAQSRLTGALAPFAQPTIRAITAAYAGGMAGQAAAANATVVRR